jgi:hypothetical protein
MDLDKQKERAGLDKLLKAYEEFNQLPKMREAIDIPTKLSMQNSTSQKPSPKEGEKGFTEIDRWKYIGGKSPDKDDGIEMGDLTSGDI